MSTDRQFLAEDTSSPGFRKVFTAEPVQNNSHVCIRITRRGKGQRWSEFMVLSRDEFAALVHGGHDVLETLPRKDA